MDQIQAAYAAARAEVEATAPAEAAPGVCRICGERMGFSSPRGTHINCMVTPAFRAWLREAWWSSPAITRKAIADALGVTLGVVAAWTGSRR